MPRKKDNLDRFIEIAADVVYFLWKWRLGIPVILTGIVAIFLIYRADPECARASLDVENRAFKILFLLACSFFGPNS